MPSALLRTAALGPLLSICAGASWGALGHEDQPSDELSLLQRSLEPRAAKQRVAHAASSRVSRGKRAEHGTTALLQGRKEDGPVPLLYVDLDLEPEARWANVTKYYKEIGAFPGALVDQLPTSKPAEALVRSFRPDEEYMREARQLVADINDPRVTLDNVFALNLRYELSGLAESPAGLQDTFATMDLQKMFSTPTEGCSGLLAAMPNGTVVHGRNMDYAGFEIPQPDGRVYHWPEVTTEIIFLKQGKPLFISVHWPGLLGVHTGMRFGGWTFEQNTRFHSVEPDILYGLLDKSKGFVFEARKALETVPDFETAVQTMYGVDYMAPMYFIMSGAKPYEGAILTIDRGGVHSPNSPQIMRLNQETTAIKDGKPYEGWHIIQTNDDLNGVPLDTRRPVEEKRLSSSVQESVGVPWVLDQMLAAPILQDSTVFTTVYVVASGYHRTIAHLGSPR